MTCADWGHRMRGMDIAMAFEDMIDVCRESASVAADEAANSDTWEEQQYWADLWAQFDRLKDRANAEADKFFEVRELAAVDKSVEAGAAAEARELAEDVAVVREALGDSCPRSHFYWLNSWA